MNGFANLDFSDRAVWGIVKLGVVWVALGFAGRDANLHLWCWQISANFPSWSSHTQPAIS